MRAMGSVWRIVVRTVCIVTAMFCTLPVPKSFGDIVDDLRIPLNDTVHSQRYRDALPMMNGVNVVVGHNFGGSVALSLSQHFRVHPIAHGAPVFDLNPMHPSGSPFWI